MNQPAQPDHPGRARQSYQSHQTGQVHQPGRSDNPDYLSHLTQDARAFALITRGDSTEVEFLGCDTADLVDVPTTADIPLPGSVSGAPGPRMLALVPFAQVRELGYPARPDTTPLRCLPARRSARFPRSTVLDRLPELALRVSDGEFRTGDEEYAGMVKRIVVDEIGRGEGANFVIRRDYHAEVDHAARTTALALFRRLVQQETGAYWTFVVCAGDQILVGATPERHVAVADGEVRMNPISGTYRFPENGPTLDGLLGFLADRKETDELVMVVDEELKQMSAVCDRGGRVEGPYLQPMGHLAHTAYHLVGDSQRDAREVLRDTMFAATVTGSPVENACRVIADHESDGRGYYGGVAALFGEDEQGRQTLDAPILIRTAYVASAELAEPAASAGLAGPAALAGSRVRVPVGATLVWHSTAEGEVEETHTKAASLLDALGVRETARSRVDAVAAAAGELFDDPAVRAALARRNERLAPFWLHRQRDRVGPLTGKRVRVVDAEDAWTQMLAHLFRRLGADVGVRRWDESTAAGEAPLEPADLVVAGPGPSDPRDADAPRISALRALLGARLAAGRPVLAVCLSHQVLADALGFGIDQLATPYQGTQRRVDVFGRQEWAGFYNTFVVRPDRPNYPDGPGDPHRQNRPGRAECSPIGEAGFALDPADVEVGTHEGEVVALRGPAFVSVQFHLESVLTTRGIDLLAELTEPLVT